jgi:hypothetical protein
VDWFSIPFVSSPGPRQWFNGWTKRRGADRLALMREGSEILTPAIELAKQVGPTGIMWGSALSSFSSISESLTLPLCCSRQVRRLVSCPVTCAVGEPAK